MSQSLPTPGGDVGTWGYMLNGFLEVSLNSDGTLNTSAVSSALPTPISTANLGTGTGSSSNFLRGDGVWAVPSGSGASNATTGAPGLVQLAGDLGGTGTTATAPTLAATGNVEGIISGNSTVAGALQTSGGTMSGAIAMGSNKITGLSAGTASADALNIGQIGQLPAQNLLPLNLPSWRNAVGQALTGTASAKILSIGTSVSQGGGVSPNAGTQSPMAYLTSMLNSLLCPAQLSFSIPQPYTATYDNRWTLASGWTLPATNGSQAGIGIGDNGFLIGANGGSGTALFTPPASEMVDSFDIWYYGASNTGVLKANVDGGTDTTVTTTNATAGYYKTTVTVTTGAAGTGHVLNLHTVTTNNVYIIGIDAYLSTQKGLHVGTASIDGDGTSTYYAAAASIASIEAYAPALTIIELGADDALTYPSNPSTGTFMTNFAAIVAAAKASGDVLVWCSMQVDPSLALTNISSIIAAFEAYVTAIIAYCVSNNIAYVDIHGRWGPFSTWSTDYDSGDHVHPNAQGNVDIAAALFNALSSVTTGQPASNAIPVLSVASGSASTFTPNSANNECSFMTSATGTITVANPTSTPVSGQKLILRIKTTGGAETYSFGNAYRGSSAQALPTTSSNNKWDYLGFIYNSVDSVWDLVAINQGF